MFLQTKRGMSIAEPGCFGRVKEEPELLPLAEDHAARETFHQFPGSIYREEAMDLASDEDETSFCGRKRRRADDERASKRRRLESFESQQQQASSFADPFYADFHMCIPATVESITRGIAELTTSSTHLPSEEEYLASF